MVNLGLVTARTPKLPAPAPRMSVWVKRLGLPGAISLCPARRAAQRNGLAPILSSGRSEGEDERLAPRRPAPPRSAGPIGCSASPPVHTTVGLLP
jgi:hypothetical protein